MKYSEQLNKYRFFFYFLVKQKAREFKHSSNLVTGGSQSSLRHTFRNHHLDSPRDLRPVGGSCGFRQTLSPNPGYDLTLGPTAGCQWFPQGVKYSLSSLPGCSWRLRVSFKGAHHKISIIKVKSKCPGPGYFPLDGCQPILNKLSLFGTITKRHHFYLN